MRHYNVEPLRVRAEGRGGFSLSPRWRKVRKGRVTRQAVL